MIKRILNSIIRRTTTSHINWIKTFFINFVFLSFKDAIRFPILIYGPCKFGDISGKITLNKNVYCGMIKIGLTDPVRSYYTKSFISIRGSLYFENTAIIRRGISLLVQNGAKMYIRNEVSIGNNSTIIVADLLEIGRNSSIGNNVVFMDTDFHYVINTEDGSVKPNHKPIKIGDNNWITAWCTVKKGSITPTGTILAGPYSMIGKDYTSIISEYSIIAGSPAKFIKGNMRRVNGIISEKMITDYYENYDGKCVYKCMADIDAFCSNNNTLVNK